MAKIRHASDYIIMENQLFTIMQNIQQLVSFCPAVCINFCPLRKLHTNLLFMLLP
jgi:hypothetical protein